MKTFFTWNGKAQALYKHWTTDSLQGLLSMMLATAVLTVSYEYIKHFLKEKAQQNTLGHQTKVRVWPLMLRSLWYAVGVVVSNVVMLFLMTYNTLLMTSAVLGAVIGHVLTGIASHRSYHDTPKSTKPRGTPAPDHSLEEKQAMNPIRQSETDMKSPTSPGNNLPPSVTSCTIEKSSLL